MSDRTKHLIAKGAAALEAPRVGLADPARAGRSVCVRSRAKRGATLALSGQRLFARRQMQTLGLKAEGRPALSAGRT